MDSRGSLLLVRDAYDLAYDIWTSEKWQLASSIIGTLFVLSIVIRIGRALLVLVRPGNLEIYCHAESGSWALVTGASDGIGYAFSSELLKRGFNVALHGRNPEKLKRIKKELAAKYPKRSVEIIVADASQYDTVYSDVVAKVKQLPGKLTILVNNVGGIMTKPQYLPHWDVPHDDIDSQLNLNLRFPTHLTRDLIPVLKENRPSLVLNCGSSSGNFGVPYIATYSSTKSYIHAFSRALKTELVAEKIDNLEVIGLWIGPVVSARNKHGMALTITSQECAAGSLDQVGKSNAPLVFCHWKHALQTWPIPYLPERLFQRMVAAEMTGRRDAERKET